jgi:hypothetical protein
MNGSAAPNAASLAEVYRILIAAARRAAEDAAVADLPDPTLAEREN